MGPVPCFPRDSKSSTIHRVVGFFQYPEVFLWEGRILLDPGLISDISDKKWEVPFIDGVSLIYLIRKGINKTWKPKGPLKNEVTAICPVIARAGI